MNIIKIEKDIYYNKLFICTQIKKIFRIYEISFFKFNKKIEKN